MAAASVKSVLEEAFTQERAAPHSWGEQPDLQEKYGCHETHRATVQKISRSPFVYLLVFTVYANTFVVQEEGEGKSMEISHKSGNFVL